MTNDDTRKTASFKEFADLLGVSPSYITKLKEAGRLVLVDEEGKKRVDIEASKALIRDTEGGHSAGAREYHQAQREQAPLDLGEPPDTVPASTPPVNDGGPVVGSTAHWNQREAAARAQLRELELEQAYGRLVDVAVVQAAGDAAGTALRSLAEQLPDQLAPALVSMTNESEIHALLTEQLQNMINQVIDQLTAPPTKPDTPA